LKAAPAGMAIDVFRCAGLDRGSLKLPMLQCMLLSVRIPSMLRNSAQ